MTNLDRRRVLGGAAVCLAACPVAGAARIGIDTSPRIIRLRGLFQKLAEINGAFLAAPIGSAELEKVDRQINETCNEIYAIGDAVWASPVQGWTDILERALVAHYWFGRELSGHHGGPGQCDVRAVQALVGAVFDFKQS